MFSSFSCCIMLLGGMRVRVSAGVRAVREDDN
ncbi:hypothetical protein, unlikely [Trypanosoma brucei brucei TREU927]|uniref:Uncharacterized protein n=1 Tax=Trypanosoma brucei brucei (strain 927/4 GUTat10.1) TaxID=185431 RepID=Q38F47_TRYB2|nr:hypothetical protein, unlikely [Trypanosoma brucei brucei TREU927]EAN76573.1 hypothetical protein, unlikely [Trypanosoma brucei brucei TREU927]